MAEHQSNIASQLDDQMKHLTILQQHSELRIVEEHEMTRSEIRAALQLLGGPVNSSKEARCVLQCCRKEEYESAATT
jgi:hypothetical protein